MVEPWNRVVLIPGASGALGSAVADIFLETGATVAGVARNWKPADVAHRSDRFLAVSADLSTAAGARTAIEKTLERTQRIDAVVHTTGGFAGGQTVAETDDATWEQMFSVNVDTAFYIFRAVLPHMIAAKTGRLIAVASRIGVEPSAGLSAYGASKAALIALVKTIALETVGTGVTANAVMPSIIDTPANRAAMPDSDFKRWVTPRSIAELILFLASESAADVSGAAIPVYGGA